MPAIRLQTLIYAPAALVFDLARSIDLHKRSTAHTNEEAIAGRTSGLIGPGEYVTWRARHFGLTQQLTSRITAFERPFSFTDEMVSGAFKSFRHDHIFEEKDGATMMTDLFEYESPFGFAGWAADALFLKRYMEALLAKRNAFIKEYAENPENRHAHNYSP